MTAFKLLNKTEIYQCLTTEKVPILEEDTQYGKRNASIPSDLVLRSHVINTTRSWSHIIAAESTFDLKAYLAQEPTGVVKLSEA